MFRNPRGDISVDPSAIPIKLAPSTGRPPTPPNTTSTRAPLTTMAGSSSSKSLTPRPTSKNTGSGSVKQTTSTSSKKPFSAKPAGKPNASILTFFKKVDGPMQDELFLAQRPGLRNHFNTKSANSALEINLDEDLYGDGHWDEEEKRFNEVEGAVKRRKIPGSTVANDLVVEDLYSVAGKEPVKNGCTPPQPGLKAGRSTSRKRKGPFLPDSDTDGEEDREAIQRGAVDAEKQELETVVSNQTDDMNDVVETEPIAQDEIRENKPVVPAIHSVAPAKRWGAKLKAPKIDVSEAQAKWEQMQPNTPPPELKEESEGSSYGEGNKKSKKNKKKTQKKDAVLPALQKESSGGDSKKAKNALVPTPVNENTSLDEWEKFEDFDEFGEGEEAFERRWMEEQARLEAEAQEEGEDDEFFARSDDDLETEQTSDEGMASGMTTACPICEASLDGIGPDDATKHVNGCLDGNPVALPQPASTIKRAEPSKASLPPGAKRFARRAAIARPGQANPFEVGSAPASASSAFSKLMSGHAEDAAWANAAAAEQKSRGKPAYQRTCPFYKIMPGFFICVDAFRYGAVQGCNAYFLSHFHSDHYIGLTSTWTHGPIYCSKVTGNLVKQQLRVDPKYVVPLDFEARFEVPGTQGVAITMIPANHCPGSSLFLFEKVIGKGAKPKVQRILHCGDFRACPAHLAHPLLMPDVVDSITGNTKQQKIDVCYLDTTYLNPKYSFPSQEEVINACADMCVSLKKDRASATDAWEVVKRERAGAGMTKFVQSPSLKPSDDSLAMSFSSDAKSRGRLLVVCGTYSIGKERICMGIARALDCKIWAPPGKMKICRALEDEELMSRMTSDPREAQIHMQMLMEIRPETLQDYLNTYKPHFSRIVGFRPSGWNYRPPNSRFTASPSIPTILHSPSWRSSFSMAELVPQRGSTREASCFGVPYSEHSSFRELTMFVCALRIEKVVPTVNVGSAPGRAKMKAWIERWMAERRKAGPVKIGGGGEEKGEVMW
ncbi:DNA cross-link repair protein pso2/snm1 [Diplocarpon rosae]|nr:DNA cross-link repair protein pso2/snm1 [Diplocarpon rosae]